MILTKSLSRTIVLCILAISISNNIYSQYFASNPPSSIRPGNTRSTVATVKQSQKQLAITNLRVRDTSTIHVYQTWNMYLYKQSGYKVPQLYTLSGSDTVPVSNYDVTWSSGDASIAGITNNVLTANNVGRTFITASLDGQSVAVPLQVNGPIRPVEYESNIDPFLTQPATGYTSLVPVVVICYIPTPDGINVNTGEAGFAPIPSQTISDLKNHIKKISRHTKFSLEEGSKFRGYKNPAAIPYVGYKIVDYIFVYEPVPRGFNDPGSSAFFGDYNSIVTRFNGKKYVDTLGVKEFWLMGYHQGEIVPAESDMSSPTTGDISNSYRFPDDLPIYSKTYVLYNYNYTREGNESTHNHGHQIESMVDYVATKQDGNSALFTFNFRGYGNFISPIGRCGDTHHPPNTNIDYDYYNFTMVASDIMDWKPGGGVQTMVNANTWGNINYNWPAGTTPNIESNWYIFWMQSLPGQGNQIPYNTRVMTNWWQFLSTWDSSTSSIGLYRNVALPIRLPSFSAYNSGNVNDLKWEIAGDGNTAYIEVERSGDGINFVLIDTVSFISNIMLQRYTDNLPLTGRNYYRLKIMDKNGTFVYSSVALVDRNAAIRIRVSPNPSKDIITITGLAANRENTVELINLTGSRVFFSKTTQAVKTVNMNTLPAGMYVLKIVSDDVTVSKKVVKQ